MSELNKKTKTPVHIVIPNEIYLAYKEALRYRIPYQNVTQDIIAYMKRVIDETTKLNKI